MARVFVFESREFPDPDPEGQMPVDEVRQLMAEHMPDLNNADVREEKRGDDTAFIFTKRIGTKGISGNEIVDIIRLVPEKRLKVFDFLADVMGPDGEVDFTTVVARKREVNLVTVEAQAYAASTQRAVAVIRETRGER